MDMTTAIQAALSSTTDHSFRSLKPLATTALEDPSTLIHPSFARLCFYVPLKDVYVPEAQVIGQFVESPFGAITRTALEVLSYLAYAFNFKYVDNKYPSPLFLIETIRAYAQYTDHSQRPVLGYRYWVFVREASSQQAPRPASSEVADIDDSVGVFPANVEADELKNMANDNPAAQEPQESRQSHRGPKKISAKAPVNLGQAMLQLFHHVHHAAKHGNSFATQILATIDQEKWQQVCQFMHGVDLSNVIDDVKKRSITNPRHMLYPTNIFTFKQCVARMKASHGNLVDPRYCNADNYFEKANDEVTCVKFPYNSDVRRVSVIPPPSGFMRSYFPTVEVPIDTIGRENVEMLIKDAQTINAGMIEENDDEDSLHKHGSNALLLASIHSSLSSFVARQQDFPITPRIYELLSMDKAMALHKKSMEEWNVAQRISDFLCFSRSGLDNMFAYFSSSSPLPDGASDVFVSLCEMCLIASVLSLCELCFVCVFVCNSYATEFRLVSIHIAETVRSEGYRGLSQSIPATKQQLV